MHLSRRLLPGMPQAVPPIVGPAERAPRPPPPALAVTVALATQRRRLRTTRSLGRVASATDERPGRSQNEREGNNGLLVLVVLVRVRRLVVQRPPLRLRLVSAFVAVALGVGCISSVAAVVHVRAARTPTSESTSWSATQKPLPSPPASKSCRRCWGTTT